MRVVAPKDEPMSASTSRLKALVGACGIALASPAATGELDRLLDAAAGALHAGDDARARDLLERASAVDDPTPEVFLALARLQLRQGDLRAADATVRRALAVAPDHAAALALAGDVLRAAGRLEEARARYDAALVADPDQPLARAGRARLHLEDGDLAAADALRVPADDRSLALRLAWADAAADEGELEAAVAKLDGVLAQNPGWLPALLRRGDFHRRLGHMAAASRDLERAVGLAAAAAEPRFRRGLLRRDLRDLEGALDDFDRAIGLDPEFAAAYVARGALYQAAGRHRSAQADFDRALAIAPEDGDALTHKAVSLCAEGDFAQCEASAEKAIARRPDDWRAHVAKGHALLGQEEPDAAVRAYGDAVEHAPEAQSHWLLARLQKHLRPRLSDRGGFSWTFLAAEDVGQVETLMDE
jgi:tetratricopeptide (TPR) repeat protein